MVQLGHFVPNSFAQIFIAPSMGVAKWERHLWWLSVFFCESVKWKRFWPFSYWKTPSCFRQILQYYLCHRLTLSTYYLLRWNRRDWESVYSTSASSLLLHQPKSKRCSNSGIINQHFTSLWDEKSVGSVYSTSGTTYIGWFFSTLEQKKEFSAMKLRKVFSLEE